MTVPGARHKRGWSGTGRLWPVSGSIRVLSSADNHIPIGISPVLGMPERAAIRFVAVRGADVRFCVYASSAQTESERAKEGKHVGILRYLQNINIESNFILFGTSRSFWWRNSEATGIGYRERSAPHETLSRHASPPSTHSASRRTRRHHYQPQIQTVASFVDSNPADGRRSMKAMNCAPNQRE
jgi:hypothetical protein